MVQSRERMIGMHMDDIPAWLMHWRVRSMLWLIALLQRLMPWCISAGRTMFESATAGAGAVIQLQAKPRLHQTLAALAERQGG